MSATAREVPTFFPAGDEELFGVLTPPATDGVRSCVVVLGGGQTASTSTGRNRIFVSMARRFAALGHHAFRFDYHGIGDSTGTSTFRLDRPFVADLDGALTFLRAREVDRFVLIGSCFGARTAMAAADRTDGIDAVVLLAPPLRDFALSERQTDGWTARDYLTALVRPQRLVGGEGRVSLRRYVRFLRSGARVAVRRLQQRLRVDDADPAWLSGHFVAGIASLVERRIPTLLIYGTGDDSYPDFLEARDGRLGDLLAHGQIRVHVVDGEVHGFTQAAAQREIVDTIAGWISEVAPGAAAAAAVGRDTA